LQIKAEFPDEDAAKEGEKAISAGLGLLNFAFPDGVKSLEARCRSPDRQPADGPHREAAKELQEALTSVKATREGSSVSVAVAVKTEVPELTAADLNNLKLAGLRSQHQNNAKQITISFHNWASTYQDRWPPAAICDKDGKPLLSWRVMILPYIDERALFREFKLDEAWGSPHNIKLLERMPKTYRLPGADAKETKTHYQILVGRNTLYPDYGKAADAATSARSGVPAGLRAMLATYSVGNIPDGTSNTILLIEASNGVPWSKPEDVMYDAQKPLPKFGKLLPDRFLVGLADGSVRFVSKKVSDKTLRMAIDPADGEILPSDW